MSKKENYKKKLKKSSLFSDEAKERANDLLNDIKEVHEKTDQKELVEKKQSMIQNVDFLKTQYNISFSF
ncbi:hypothetical protein BTO06_03915 [Tenacibaculum sp. SZ-18]|uniref:hypothetical protein n=1 Tax=Tenacibaculum sp. SZ-18 TaxID=754423 RepID=UPI000C2D614C|nr:hypothetical protein [Tenacibaculum sp. SZ-18]AUC14338.1 hypothetical protein BTO06_03915 [Tenacibaculum sp. SZ-18]